MTANTILSLCIKVTLTCICFIYAITHTQAQHAEKSRLEQAKEAFTEVDSIADPDTYFETGSHLAGQYIEVFKINNALSLYERLSHYAQAIGNTDKYHEIQLAICQIYTLQNRYDDCFEISQMVLNAPKVTPENKITAIFYGYSYYFNIDDYNSAEKSLKHFLNLAIEQKDSIKISNGYSSMGRVYQAKGNIEGAIKMLLKAVETTTSKSNRYILMGHYDALARLYSEQGNSYKALEYIDKSIELTNQHNFPKSNAIYNTRKARFLFLAGRLDASDSLYMHTLEKIRENKYDNLAHKVFLGQARSAIERKDFNHVKVYIDSLENYKQHIKNNFDRITYNLVLANYHMHQNNLKEARDLVQSAYYLIEDSDNIRLKRYIYEMNYQLSKRENKTVDALQNLEALMEIKDSLFQSDQMVVVNELEALYNKQEQEEKIDMLNMENEITNLKLSQQQTITMISVIASLLLMGLLYYITTLNEKLKSQNKIIQQAVSEKDTLLREIHHRVKNNLQFISSLLKLQSRHIDDPNAISALKDGQDRVKSMALIHQNLYQEDNLTGVDLKNYFEKLISNLFYSYNIREDQIQLHLDIDDLNLDVDSVIPVGLIVNELISNALKHAFPGDRKGQILVSLHETDKGLKLKIKDDGIGMDNIDQSKMSQSFGYRMINTFKAQLDGEINISGEKGTEIELLIRDYKKIA